MDSLLLNSSTIEIIVFSFAIFILLSAAFVFYHFYHFRFVSFVRNDHTLDMDPASIEGYSDKYYYLPGESISFYLCSEYEHNSLLFRKMTAPNKFYDVLSQEFTKSIQVRNPDSSEQGCGWKKTLEIRLDENIRPGYYQAFLTSQDGAAEYTIIFIIGSLKKSDIILVAPVSTWNAYNTYGGKSLYQNTFEAKTVYNLSSLRPNNAFLFNHDIHVEVNAFNWFAEKYESVNIIPDYYLESKDVLVHCKILVLVYHCEYISQKMYDNTLDFLNKGRSMISLGANQYYWRIRWHDNYSRMECRKDLTFFEGSFKYGGMWKHHFRRPQNLFGEDYSGSGMHTFAPYKVLDSSHWLFEGTQICNGDLFGMHGINEFGICGAETDKAKKTSDIEIIAHGMNCDSEKTGKNYDATNPEWNGNGGGDIVLKKHPKNNAVLSTGSIQSCSGLGIDPVFTAIIKNFISRYLPSL